jgi:D-alanyl-D-alanine dipeptidase
MRPVSERALRVAPAMALAFMILVWLVAGCGAEGPPKEQGVFRQPDLVELVRLDPTIHLDVRYATADNFLGRPVYPEARIFLQRPAAEAVVRASTALRAQGYGLAAFDGYRPWFVTKEMFDVTPADKKDFVADPKDGSRHNRGCAVDLTLYDLATGQEVTMPSEFDEMSERADPTYQGGTEESRRLRDLLRSAMEAEGFTVFKIEWWHFDYKDWREYPLLNLTFSEIKVSWAPRRAPAAAASGRETRLAA